MKNEDAKSSCGSSPFTCPVCAFQQKHANMSSYALQLVLVCAEIQNKTIYVCVFALDRACFHKGVYRNDREKDGPLKTSQWEMGVKTDAARETANQ